MDLETLARDLLDRGHFVTRDGRVVTGTGQTVGPVIRSGDRVYLAGQVAEVMQRLGRRSLRGKIFHTLPHRMR